MGDRVCVYCGGPLSGPQRKYDSEECRKAYARDEWYLRTYALTPDDWRAVWAHQGERCAICRRARKEGETFHVDHEHATGQSGPVRGILCPYCNTRLVGRLKSAERAQALADYLARPPAVEALGRVVIAPGRPRTRRRTRVRRRTR
ncbi:endonuclease VII domain-containing protein [Micromonospora avicenniae]|uniref:endonuclease VII domain-containing protein n=1 Tax=Micromonospora avicenniae TaxID=1198245 RepID=UPI0033261A38